MIYGIGRNYASHAKELGNAVPKGAPIVFFKPQASIITSGRIVKLPSFSQNVQYEVEVAFRFDEKLEIGDICVANDLTARDKQKEAQESKSPWALAKGFKQSCGLGNWVSSKGVQLSQLELKLVHNGRVAQRGFTKDMVFDFGTLVHYLRENFPVEPGDIVLTGTPEGVGPVKSGDRVQAEIVGLSVAEWTYE